MHNSEIQLYLNFTLQLKPDKDASLPSSYCLLLLINTDTTIIIKALANRIETITPFMIHHGQTGFIQEMHSQINTRRLCSITHVTWDSKETIIDNAKSLNWGVIHQPVKATVQLTNHHNKGANHQALLCTEMREGCPPSPIPLYCFIKFFAVAACQNKHII